MPALTYTRRVRSNQQYLISISYDHNDDTVDVDELIDAISMVVGPLLVNPSIKGEELLP